MSKRIRFTDIAIGFVAGVGLALLFLVWAVPEFRHVESASKYHQSWEAPSQAEESQLGENHHSWVPILRGWAYFEDSLAQWLMAVLSIAATLVSIWAVRLVRKTLDANTEAVRIGRDANVHSEETSRLELRAYLAVEPLGIKQLVGRDQGIGLVQVHNVGRLPARNVSVLVRMTVCDRNQWQGFHEECGQASDRTIHPGAAMLQGSKDYALAGDICGDSGHVFVWGQVHYFNGYGLECWTRFCHRYARASYNAGVSAIDSRYKGLFLIDKEKARYHTSGNEAT